MHAPNLPEFAQQLPLAQSNKLDVISEPVSHHAAKVQGEHLGAVGISVMRHDNDGSATLKR